MGYEATAYRLEVLEHLSSGRRSLTWAKWRLRHGSLLRRICRHLPALFLVIDVHAHKGPHIFIPLMILPLWILGMITLPIIQLVLKYKKKKAIPGLAAGLWMLFRLQFSGRGPLVLVKSNSGDKVNIRLW